MTLRHMRDKRQIIYDHANLLKWWLLSDGIRIRGARYIYDLPFMILKKANIDNARSHCVFLKAPCSAFIRYPIQLFLIIWGTHFCGINIPSISLFLNLKKLEIVLGLMFSVIEFSESIQLNIYLDRKSRASRVKNLSQMIVSAWRKRPRYAIYDAENKPSA